MVLFIAGAGLRTRWSSTRTTRAMARPTSFELQGTIGSAPAIDRTIGFKEVIKDYPNYRIIASESGDFFRDQGYEVMKGILARERRKIRRPLRAQRTTWRSGRSRRWRRRASDPGRTSSSSRSTPPTGAFKAMIEGKLSCTVECNPLLGPQIMKAVQDYISGKDLPIRMITSEGVFPAEKARQYLAGREY